MEMGGLPFPNMHVREENIDAVLVPSFCHPVTKADLLDFMGFQTCNDDLRVLSDVLPELGLIRQTKAFFVHSQTENVSDETVHVSVLLKVYVCMSDS